MPEIAASARSHRWSWTPGAVRRVRRLPEGSARGVQPRPRHDRDVPRTGACGARAPAARVRRLPGGCDHRVRRARRADRPVARLDSPGGGAHTRATKAAPATETLADSGPPMTVGHTLPASHRIQAPNREIVPGPRGAC